MSPALEVVRRLTMNWETPTAIDLRFGMEITMYISHR
jgi:coenzyme PQQ precursor peptide PqqA